MSDRGHAGRYYDIKAHNAGSTVLTKEVCLDLPPAWGYGTDERGLYCYLRKVQPITRYRTIPSGMGNRRHRREIGIRNPLVILEDYQQTKEYLTND